MTGRGSSYTSEREINWTLVVSFQTLSLGTPTKVLGSTCRLLAFSPLFHAMTDLPPLVRNLACWLWSPIYLTESTWVLNPNIGSGNPSPNGSSIFKSWTSPSVRSSSFKTAASGTTGVVSTPSRCSLQYRLKDLMKSSRSSAGRL